jgi:hypothetical protein
MVIKNRPEGGVFPKGFWRTVLANGITIGYRDGNTVYYFRFRRKLRPHFILKTLAVAP